MSRPSVALRVADAATAPAEKPAPASPCTVVIFGVTGDLARRKLLPSLFHLLGDGLLDGVRIVGVGRKELGDDGFRQAAREALKEFGPKDGVDGAAWKAFAAQLSYVAGDLDDAATYQRLAAKLGPLAKTLPPGSGRLFYLALPPSLYATVARQLAASGLAPRPDSKGAGPWARLIVEKPFGKGQASARELNALLRRVFAEDQVYRIDHYLGKETVQNMMVLRFANATLEPLWNHAHVEQVQITAAETVGVEHRADYYDSAGVVRDMFQNHLLQLLTLTAMEPPSSLGADAVRDRKLEVLRAIRPLGAGGWDGAVRGQYGPGVIQKEKVPGYREEEDVARDSTTPTFAAVRMFVDAPRWTGVPFLLRSGKRMASHASEIAVTFRKPPHELFRLPGEQAPERNVLVVRVQPHEGIALHFEVKVPGTEFRLASADMDFSYAEAFRGPRHDAYETLLLDAMRGDATLFTRHDEVEAAWGVVDPLIAHWESTPAPQFPNYAAGTWGPEDADRLISGGIAWRRPRG